jgi:hypothetical protein
MNMWVMNVAVVKELPFDTVGTWRAMFAFCEWEIPPLPLLRLLLLQVVLVLVLVVVVVVVEVTLVHEALRLPAGSRVLVQALTHAVICFLHRQCTCRQNLNHDRWNQNAAPTVGVRWEAFE